ncbi:MAG TPA: hypothetical protein VNA68_03355 [Candidatus Dormibacteraeota bacterium]|nr:hypothetical protein [Candidatus Dormibacteraeota bacterium]
MNLLSWEPHLYLQSGPTSVAVLEFEGVLQCPVCKYEFQVKPSGHLIHENESLDKPLELKMRLDWEIDSLSERRGCTECGVVSDLPIAQYEKFVTEACELLTADFIRQELQRIRDEADAIWEKEHGYSALAAR